MGIESNTGVKEAKAAYDINSLILKRWSPRAFSGRMPSKEQVLKLTDAARWAPSSFNEQPWRFIVGIKNSGRSYEKIFRCLNTFNQQWAGNAPVLMLVCAKRTFSHNGKVNRHYMYDCGASMANLCLQATADGLYVHQMAGIHPEKAVELFRVPDDFQVITGVAIGYLGNPEMLNEKNQNSESAKRTRKALSEIAFFNEWGRSFAEVTD